MSFSKQLDLGVQLNTKLCTKLILLDGIINKRLMNTIEDLQLIDDVQEGFRRHRSAKRQLCKIHGILANQRRRKASRSVMLYLDIKNAFNAVNHRAIFQVLEAYGFSRKDIEPLSSL